ncbi:MAG: Gfo/Idh/MocA family oxidoreductase, partial [Desulfobacterales bacterium]
MVSEKKLKLGIIGFGRIAAAHADSILELYESVELTAVATRQVEKQKNITEKFSPKKFYFDYHELLSDQEIDAIIVCLPNYLHHQVCIEAARAKKHILVEKPIAMNVMETDEMIKAAQENEITLMVAQSRRFSDAMMKIREEMISKIGPPFRIDIHFLVNFPQPPTDWWKKAEKAGGLVTLLQGSHSVDTILWLLNKMPATIFSASRSRNPLWEGEDEVDIVLGFDSGELVAIHLSLNTSPYLHETIIVGPEGTIRLFEYPTDKAFGFFYRLDFNGNTVLEGEQDPSLYTIQLKEFCKALWENRTPIASGLEVRNTMMILDAIRKSDSEGEVI